MKEEKDKIEVAIDKCYKIGLGIFIAQVILGLACIIYFTAMYGEHDYPVNSFEENCFLLLKIMERTCITFYGLAIVGMVVSVINRFFY